LKFLWEIAIASLRCVLHPVYACAYHLPLSLSLSLSLSLLLSLALSIYLSTSLSLSLSLSLPLSLSLGFNAMHQKHDYTRMCNPCSCSVTAGNGYIACTFFSIFPIILCPSSCTCPELLYAFEFVLLVFAFIIATPLTSIDVVFLVW